MQHGTLVTMTFLTISAAVCQWISLMPEDACRYSDSPHHDRSTMCSQQGTLIPEPASISMTLHADGLHHPSADAPHHSDVITIDRSLPRRHHSTLVTRTSSPFCRCMPTISIILHADAPHHSDAIIVPAHPSDSCPIYLSFYYILFLS